MQNINLYENLNAIVNIDNSEVSHLTLYGFQITFIWVSEKMSKGFQEQDQIRTGIEKRKKQ